MPAGRPAHLPPMSLPAFSPSLHQPLPTRVHAPFSPKGPLSPICSMPRTSRRQNARPSTPRRAKRIPPKPAATDLTASERLHKILAHMGVASRRKAELLIAEGRVRVNGRTATPDSALVNPFKDRIAVDGTPVELPRRHVWLAVHKPRGVLSLSRSGKRSLQALVPRADERGLVVVGGIHENASGVVVMTNERASAAELSKPDNLHVKEWVVDCEGVVEEAVVQRMRRGVALEADGEPVLPTDVNILGSGLVEVDARRKVMLTRFEVRLRDSRRHAIRRMFEVLGCEVYRTSRRAFGPVQLGSLKRGDFRYLTPKEIKALKRGVSEKNLRYRKRQ